VAAQLRSSLELMVEVVAAAAVVEAAAAAALLASQALQTGRVAR
jgi:hypothetical protein